MMAKSDWPLRICEGRLLTKLQTSLRPRSELDRERIGHRNRRGCSHTSNWRFDMDHDGVDSLDENFAEFWRT